MKKLENLIPAAATVTLPAADYYSLIKLANDLIAEREIQIAALYVELSGNNPAVRHALQKPYDSALAERVAQLLVQNKEVLSVAVEKNEHFYDPYTAWLSTYSGGKDLLDFPEFARAWEEIKTQAEKEVLHEDE